ncbi:MAG: RNA polymerase Rpb4 family protein [Candidatus Aenigmatarchaeota archaeon]
MKIIESKPISMTEAKEILSSRESRKELSYEQKLALEHLNKFTKLKQEDAKKLEDELSGVLRMSQETLVQILNFLPKNPDEVRMIFSREKFSLKEDEINKILEITKKYS